MVQLLVYLNCMYDTNAQVPLDIHSHPQTKVPPPRKKNLFSISYFWFAVLSPETTIVFMSRPVALNMQFLMVIPLERASVIL